MPKNKYNYAHNFMNTIKIIASALAFSISSSTIALDKNGNFESMQEQDTFIAGTLKKMAGEMNS